MNERIIELAAKASGKQSVGASDFADWITLDKFAELIIKECTNRLRDIDWDFAMMQEFGCTATCTSDAMLYAAIDIEEYFGVE